MKVEFQYTMKLACVGVDVVAHVNERTDDVRLESVTLEHDAELNMATVLPTRVRKEIADAAREAADDLRGQDPSWGDAAE